MKEIERAIYKYMKLLGYEFDNWYDEDNPTICESKKPKTLSKKDEAIVKVFQAIYEELEEEFINKYLD